MRVQTLRYVCLQSPSNAKMGAGTTAHSVNYQIAYACTRAEYVPNLSIKL